MIFTKMMKNSNIYLNKYPIFTQQYLNTFSTLPNYSGEYDEQSSTAHFPEWSWDTVQTYIKARLNTAKRDWTQNDFQLIADSRLAWYGLGSAETVTTMAENVKAYNDQFKFMFYWNSKTIWGEASDEVGWNDEWALGGVTATGARASQLYNHSIPAMRQWWLNHALLMDSYDVIGKPTIRNPQANAYVERIHSVLADCIRAMDLSSKPHDVTHIKCDHF